jgi:hypothetical protein
MGGVENDPAEPADIDHAAGDPPLTVELLADLQAGLLDDAQAGRLRKRIRADPAAQRTVRALNQVRRDVGALGTDATSAHDPPLDVIAGIETALQSAASRANRSAASSRAAHAAGPGLPRSRAVAAAAGVAAAVVAMGLGTAALLRAPTPAPSAPTTAEHITVSPRPRVIPLSDEQILELLHRSPDYGLLSDTARRGSCLTGLGYPASTRVLGAQPIQINGLPAVLLVLPGDTPDGLAALAVSPNCSSADTGLLAETVVRRP